MTKQQLRQQMLKERRAVSELERQAAAQNIVSLALKIPELTQAKCVGLYWPHDGELSLIPLWQELLKQKKQTCFPRVNPADKTLQFFLVNSRDDLTPGAYGIQEPKPNLQAVRKNDIQAVCIPGLAFDKAGNRLGWGQGYFDQWLSSYTGFRLGIAYDFQLQNHIPTAPHDEKLHAVLTNESFLSIA